MSQLAPTRSIWDWLFLAGLALGILYLIAMLYVIAEVLWI